MVVIAVAGGLGDLGKLIVEALLDTGKHEVYVLSRRVGTQVIKPDIYKLTEISQSILQ